MKPDFQSKVPYLHEPRAAPLLRVRPDVERLAHHITRQSDLAQDLAQEVLLHLWVRLRAGEDIHDLRAYAKTALRNAYRQRLRAHRCTETLSEDLLYQDPEAFAHMALREVDAAITRLPAEQAYLIRLVAEGETSPIDLARRTGLPKGTVMSRLARARATLREDLGVGPRGVVSSLI